MPLVEKRYAEALVDIALNTGAVEEFENQLGFITEIFTKDVDIKAFLLNPKMDTDSKKAVLEKSLKGSLKGEMINFVMILLDKGRIKYLPGIMDEFVRMADKARSVLDITVFSAADIEQSQLSVIKEKYRKQYNAVSVRAEVKIDKELIGGVKVQIGDKVQDGTIKGRLEELKGILMA
jgi:F-type H+-transporting ATPase subunit delta